MIVNNKPRLVGIIAATHGIQGQALIHSYTELHTNILVLPLIDALSNIISLKLIRINNKGHLICKINNSNDIIYTQSLVKTKLYCLPENLPKLYDDEYYIEDLKGTLIYNTQEQEIGRIINIFNFGAGDIIEIKFTDNKIELFPFTKEYFPLISTSCLILSKRLG